MKHRKFIGLWYQEKYINNCILGVLDELIVSRFIFSEVNKIIIEIKENNLVILSETKQPVYDQQEVDTYMNIISCLKNNSFPKVSFFKKALGTFLYYFTNRFIVKSDPTLTQLKVLSKLWRNVDINKNFVQALLADLSFFLKKNQCIDLNLRTSRFNMVASTNIYLQVNKSNGNLFTITRK